MARRDILPGLVIIVQAWLQAHCHDCTGHPSSPAAPSGCDASVVQCSGGAAGSDRVGMEPQVEEKQSEHESKSEMVG